jgi:hypothetical protein
MCLHHSSIDDPRSLPAIRNELLIIIMRSDDGHDVCQLVQVVSRRAVGLLSLLCAEISFRDWDGG